MKCQRLVSVGDGALKRGIGVRGVMREVRDGHGFFVLRVCVTAEGARIRLENPPPFI